MQGLHVPKLPSRLLSVVAALALPASVALAGVPIPSATTPKPLDLGALEATSSGPITVTIAMKLHDPDGALALLQALYDPKSASFHNFLSADEFRARFAPSAADVATVTASFAKFGLSVERASSTTLRVTGTPAQLEAAFATNLHRFSVAAEGTKEAYSFRAPVKAATIPAEAAPLVQAVIGLSTRPAFHPHMKKLPDSIRSVASKPQGSAPAGGSGYPPGEFLVNDFAALYGVDPLYAKGVTGKGKTLGIVTLAAFTPSDAFAYWSAAGLTVNPNRLTVVNVDGGPGAPSDASGSDETSLDVEQSGGVAPGANVIVYQAPNTSQAFVDAFASAIDANIADTISTSWGEWEWFDNLENSPVTTQYNGSTQVSTLQAYDELFLQAALQGQSLFASAGDSGAYDVNDASYGAVPPNVSLALTVDSPASDPFITAAGGTTLPGTQTFTFNDPSLPPFSVTIKNERVWSWDYLDGLCTELGYTPIACGIFPVGGGGGVSVYFKTPFYQSFTPGIRRSQPNQSVTDYAGIFTGSSTPTLLYNLPANYPGRNLPDVSANADPDTGYQIYYTSDQTGFGILTFIGGTSFVAPQLNGVTALLNQYLHGRVGLMNIPYYLISDLGGSGASSKSPLHPIKYGNNEFYNGGAPYTPAAGLGVINAANLAEAMHDIGFGR